jgi:hypothetical protein
MYYPFVRGKQFELIMLREMAPRIAKWRFVPIIESVKGNFSALKKAIDKLVENECRFILIANPSVGELKEDSSSLWDEIFNGPLRGYKNYSAGLSLTADDSLETASAFFASHNVPVAVIHFGFSEGKGLAALIKEKRPNISEHVFVGPHSSMLYRKHFKDIRRVLVKDGFVSRNNREYPLSEPFSELYLIYSEDMGCDAFGDFLIVGSDYKDGGGPAYAIAIHLTYSDPDADNIIAIKHFVSDQVDTPKDPAGKFLEALTKLANDVQKTGSTIYKTTAVEEYLQLYRDQHFPGLGYVKKLSMQHHIELMAHLLNKEK